MEAGKEVVHKMNETRKNIYAEILVDLETSTKRATDEEFHSRGDSSSLQHCTVLTLLGVILAITHTRILP